MTRNSNQLKDSAAEERSKQPWNPPKLTRIGNVSRIVRPGQGKSVITTGDRGDYLKPRGQG